MLVDNRHQSPGHECFLYEDRYSSFSCYFNQAIPPMDPFFSEEDEPGAKLSVAADSSTCSPFLQVPVPGRSSSYFLEALNQCVQNMVPDDFSSTAGPVDTSAVAMQQQPAAKRCRTIKTGPRRHKANARERQRMHGLNGALDNLRRLAPIVSDSQKLSKIETLRLTRNYIQLLNSMLNDDSAGPGASSSVRSANVLTRGLSQSTTNVIDSLLGVNHRTSICTAGGRSSDGDHSMSSGPSKRSDHRCAYHLNDLLVSFNHQWAPNTETPIGTTEEDGAQLESITDLLAQEHEERPSVSDPIDSSWIGQDHWDASSFEFDEPSIDF